MRGDFAKAFWPVFGVVAGFVGGILLPVLLLCVAMQALGMGPGT